MNKKSPIDRIRDSGGSMEIGTIEDGAILDMININDKRLIIIKERSIYEYLRADDIDPDRTNINLPSQMQKLIIAKGPDSEIVGKTILTAKTLFKPVFFDVKIDIERLLNLSIDFLIELSVLEKEINNYLQRESKLIKEYEQKIQENISYVIPSIGEVETICKTIFQKTDHLEQILMEIITVFYPNLGLTKQSHFPKLHTTLKSKYGEENSFVRFIDDITEFMMMIRNLRNGLDHRLDTVKVQDFEIQADSTILTPSIELNHKKSKLKREALSSVLPIVFQNCIHIFETTLAHLSNQNLKPSILAHEVKEIPLEKRKYKHVQYCFWSPIGENGYFNQ